MRSLIFIGEHARVLFKLSEALEQEPGEEAAARRHRQEAETLLRHRFPDEQATGIEATYNGLVSVLWR
jgi:hypothetical protein